MPDNNHELIATLSAQLQSQQALLQHYLMQISQLVNSSMELKSLSANLEITRTELMTQHQDRANLVKFQKNDLMPDFIAMVAKECARHPVFYETMPSYDPRLQLHLINFMQQGLILKDALALYPTPAFYDKKIAPLENARNALSLLMEELEDLISQEKPPARLFKTQCCKDAEVLLKLVTCMHAHVDLFFEKRKTLKQWDKEIQEKSLAQWNREVRYQKLTLAFDINFSSLFANITTVKDEITVLQTKLKQAMGSVQKTAMPQWLTPIPKSQRVITKADQLFASKRTL